jgi:hypothetical protein
MAQQTVGRVNLAAQSRSSPLRHVFCCPFTPQSLTRLKREQGQPKTNDLPEHALQSCLIRQRPREQGGLRILMLDA